MLKCASCGHDNANDAHFCKNCGAPLRKGDPSDPLVHRMVGSYRLLSRIGEGGFGVVYEARHITLDTTFAVKILHPQFSANEQVAERFRREALAAGKLRHEHVVSIADYGHAAGVGFYYAMEYLQGRSLKAVMDSEGPLPLERILHIAQQVTSAMQRVHEQKILHRDLKPDNIFLIEKDGTCDYVKLVDFGIAKILGDEEGAAITKTGLSVGTPLYMSPEQARGQLRNLDHRTDIYSWSVILFEMLTGRVPFFSEAPHEVLLMHIKGRPPRLSDMNTERMYSPELETLFRRLLSKNPQDRPTSMVDLYRILEKQLRIPNAILDLRTQPDPASFANVDEVNQTAQVDTPTGVQAPPSGVEAAKPAITTDEVQTDLSLSSFETGEFLARETPEPTLLPQVLRSEEAEDDSSPRSFRLRGSPELRRIERFAAARKRKQDSESPDDNEDTASGAVSPFFNPDQEREEAEVWDDVVMHDDEPTANISRDELLAQHQESLETTEESPDDPDEDTLSTSQAPDTEPMDIASFQASLDEQDESTLAGVSRPEPPPRIIPKYQPWYMRLPLAARIGIPAALVLGLVMLIVLLQWQHNAHIKKQQAAKAKLPPGHLYAPRTRPRNVVVVVKRKKAPARSRVPARRIPAVRVLPGLRPLPQNGLTPQKSLQNGTKPLKTGQPAPTYVTLTIRSTPRAVVFVGRTRLGLTPQTLKRPKGEKQRIRLRKKGYRARSFLWKAQTTRVWDPNLKRVVVTKKVTPRNNGQPKPRKRTDIFHTGPNPFKNP